MIRELTEFSKKHDLESVGLIMEDELIEEWYECTPLNCLTFASTGGDGVHFSIIKDLDQSPVVMTVPMNFDEENLVIANSLYEFLCLGSHFGFFNLEQLSYNFETTTNEIEQTNQSSHSNKVLSKLAKAFNLKTISIDCPYLIGAINF